MPSSKTAGPLSGIASRHLQWASIEEAVDVAAEIGFTSIEWSVRPGAHIEPAEVARQLPIAIERTRRTGLAVDMISANLLDDRDPFAERIIAAAGDSGVRLYRGAAAYRWNEAGDRVAQLEAVKRRISSLAALNARHGVRAAFHTYSGAGMIGGNLWDLWSVLRSFDPKLVGFNYDVAHTLARNGPGWRDALTIAAPYVHAVSVKDFLWRRSDRGWTMEWVPIGEGVVDFGATFEALDALGLDGPLILQIEHHGLLGDSVGKATLSMTRAEFISIVTRDLAAVMHVPRGSPI